MRQITEDEIRKISPEHFEAFENELEKAGKSLGDFYFYINAVWYWYPDSMDETATTPDDPVYVPVWQAFQALRKDFAKKTQVEGSRLELELSQNSIGTQGEVTEFVVCGSVIETLSPSGKKLNELLDS